MTSGRMYLYKGDKPLKDAIKYLIKYHKISDFDYVLVNNKEINDEKTIENIKIVPDSSVLPYHYWFIKENT